MNDSAASAVSGQPPEALPLALRRVYADADQLMHRIVLGHGALAILLAGVYGTWAISAAVVATTLGVFLFLYHYYPGSPPLRGVAGVALQVFANLHIYQLHGLNEIHLFALIALTLMIIYRDSTSLLPALLACVGLHVGLSLANNAGLLRFYSHGEPMPLNLLTLHCLIAVIQAGVCAYWAQKLRHQLIADARVQAELTQLRVAARQQSAAIEETAAELRANNQALARTNVTLDQAFRAEKQIRKKLKQKMDELQLTQNHLVQSEKMVSLGLLTAGVAHEINNPINFVAGGINALEKNLRHLYRLLDHYDALIQQPELAPHRPPIDALKASIQYAELKPELFALVGSVRTGAARTAEIVSGLRHFSRTDDEEKSLADLHESLDAALLILQARIDGRVEVHKHYDPTLPAIACYPGQLSQVLLNILANALHAIEMAAAPAGHLALTTQYCPQAAPPRVEIRIRDSGVGMSEATLARIFEPFYTTKAVGQGTGLGLSISFGIIQKHMGKIEVESKLGKGTEFCLTLPIQ